MKEKFIQRALCKTTCDVRDCRNAAEYAFAAKGRPGKFFLCKDCLADLAAEGAALAVPKSPENTIKKIMKRKEEERLYVRED